MLTSDQALLIDLLRSFWSTNEKDPGHPTGTAIFKGASLLSFLSKTRQERKLPRWLNDAEVGVQRVAEGQVGVDPAKLGTANRGALWFPLHWDHTMGASAI